jgi:hypothetical protein
MTVLEDYVAGCLAEAEVDYIPLWGIAQYFQNNVGVKSVAIIKENSLIVAQKLIEHNILPGHMIKGGGFEFWSGTPVEQLARISAEWPKVGIPTLASSHCWFALKRY